MSFRARIQPILVFLCLTALALQGCSVSSGGDGGGGGGGRADGTINLDLDTNPKGIRTIVTGGNDLVIQLTVTDGAGNGVAGAEVRFSTSTGTLDGPIEKESVKPTDANGVAMATLTSSMAVETARVTAEVLGFSQAIRISFVSGVPAPPLEMSAVPNVLAPGAKTTVRVTVREADGKPVRGVLVQLSIPTNSSGASLTPNSGITGPNGQVLSEYTAGALLGTDVVRAEVGENLFKTINLSVQITTVVPSDLQLFVSSPQMDSDGSDVVTLTALVRDVNGIVVPGIEVGFSAANSATNQVSGELQVISDTTDQSGTATAELRSQFDPSNRIITVKATAGTLTATNTVDVTGTVLTVSGTNSVAFKETSTLSIALQDSSGNGIPDATVNISALNSLFDTKNQALLDTDGDTLPDVTTDFNGQATFKVRGDMSGTDKITVSALGAPATFALTVSSDTLTYTVPDLSADPTPDVPFTVLPQMITVKWLESGVPVPDNTDNVNFTITRGTFVSTGTSAASVPTVGGLATVQVTSTTAGFATITATGDKTGGGGPSNQLTIEFVATTPASLILQASPSTIGVNTGGSTDQQSVITAIVRDAAGNLVKNQTVTFVLTDPSGGTISQGTATTDSFGKASTVYTAGPVSSAQDGVVIDASVAGLSAQVTLTVAAQELFIVLGTDNLVQPLPDAKYAKRYVALVTDANGNPIEGAKVELNLYPTRYQKGFYVPTYDADGKFVIWSKFLTIIASPPNVPDDSDRACDNEDDDKDGVLDNLEDINGNGLLDAGEDLNGNGVLDEDTNGNGVLDPRNVAEIPTSVPTDATGFAPFDITYARDETWVEVQIEARVSVVGSEASTQATFFLPGLLSDFNVENVAPPGSTSPFGTATTCNCDELTNSACASITGPVQITPLTTTLPAAGGTTAPFAVLGGVESTTNGYTVTTTLGTLTDPDETGLTTITVNFGQTFTLTLPVNGTSAVRTITVTATDKTTGQSGTATVTQEKP